VDLVSVHEANREQEAKARSIISLMLRGHGSLIKSKTDSRITIFGYSNSFWTGSKRLS
jgi:hypothetical protein